LPKSTTGCYNPYMIISYQGAQSFKVQFGDTVLAFDPVSKGSKFKTGNYGADIALISLNHPDMNGIDQVNRGEKQAFIINGPCEYEIQGVFIKGLLSSSGYDGEERINTIYTVNFENMNLCFLGALGNAEIPSETKAGIDDVDILFVPIGGNGVLSPAEAYKFAVSLEPSIIIPMNFDEKSLKAFLKEGGGEGVKPTEKLTIKKKDLEGKEGEIIVLEAQ
jgi:L-ascorbate metabolism protein UlaG (beta-lactamase superfamily)